MSIVVGGLGGGETVTWNEEGKDLSDLNIQDTEGAVCVDVNVTKGDRR